MTWGYMVGAGRTRLIDAWWISFFPGLAIFLAVLALNLVGEGLNDALNPRLSEGAADAGAERTRPVGGRADLGAPAGADRPHAVERLSLAINPGETLCVVGESGSGKSMLAHAVMGLLPSAVKPAGGAIKLSGRDLLGLSPEAMRAVRGREIGMIFQEPMTSLNPVMRIGRQIHEMFEAHGALSAAERERAAPPS